MELQEPQAATTDVVEEIVGLIRTINRGLRRRLAVQDPAGLTIPQMLAVRLVVREPGLTLTELSRRLGLANSTVSALVDRLERDGLVVRRGDEVDRRISRLHPTPAALERRERYAAAHRAALAEVLGRLSHEELSALRRSLSALARAIDSPE